MNSSNQMRAMRVHEPGGRFRLDTIPRPALLRPPYVDAVFARDDLKPAFVQAARLLL